MKLRKSFETQNNIPNWNSEERCTQLEASLNYYKSKSADCAFCILFFLAHYFFFLMQYTQVFNTILMQQS